VDTGDPIPVRRKRRRRRRLAKGARRSEVSAATRIEILKSAAAAFRRLGYHGATVEQIAAALRMKKGNLYYYFKNKEAILYFCHDYSLDILLERLRTVEREKAAPDVKLRQLIVAFIHMILDELHGTALTMDLQALTPAHLRKVVAKRDRFDRGLRAVIREGIRRGEFRRGDEKLFTFAILGAANWITRWYDPRGPQSSDHIAESFADYLVAGLRPASSRARRG
jgi:AcrR family transcriptional regulator